MSKKERKKILKTFKTIINILVKNPHLVDDFKTLTKKK